MSKQKDTNSKILCFTGESGFTVFSVSNDWCEIQENADDAAALFNRAIHDEHSGFKDLTPKLLREV